MHLGQEGSILGPRGRCTTFLTCAAAICIGGCSSGIVFTRCFTPDSKQLIWMEPWTVKKTDCATGRTKALGDGDFALSSDGRYVLIVPSGAWWQQRNHVKLIRLKDGKKWTLPPLPGLDDPNYFAPRTPVNLVVESQDDPSLSFSFILGTETREKKEKRPYTYRCGRWETSDAVEATDEEKALRDHVYPDGMTASENERILSRSPDGKYRLYEYSTEWDHYAELQTSDGRKVSRLTTQTNQHQWLLAKIWERIYYGK